MVTTPTSNPTADVLVPVMRRADRVGFLVISVAMIAAIAWFAANWSSASDWKQFPFTLTFATVLVAIIVGTRVFRWALLPFMRRPRAIEPAPNLKVAVVTAFVPGAEGLDMLTETLRALCALRYPHDTWVLDEGNNASVKGLCRQLGVFHFSRQSLAQYQTESGRFEAHTKHGNYNAWLSEIGFSRYDFLSAFDVDHVPSSDFLHRVLGHFADPRVGYVQAAQAYSNQAASFIARGAAEESYEFYSTIQMANYGLGSTAIIGSHNTHRMAALNEVGGLAPHAADDLLLSWLYRRAGWRGVYVPEILARGHAPADWRGYLIQQRRWARAVLDLKFRTYPKLATRRSGAASIMNLLHGIHYLQPGFVGLLTLLLLTVALATGSAPNAIAHPFWPAIIVLVLVFGVCDIYKQRFYLDREREMGLHWRAHLLRVAKWPFILAALVDVATNRRVPYALTPKSVSSSRHWLLLIAHGPVIALLGCAWVFGVLSGHRAPAVVEAGAAIVMVVTLAIICSELFRVDTAFSAALQQENKSAV